ncbi:hypothetical protein EDB87DRAFT_1577119 [Lactarius vividus]|nr:hypothetical protein EDB87DRAFT_1577119 [Lactarius vividus]
MALSDSFVSPLTMVERTTASVCIWEHLSTLVLVRHPVLEKNHHERAVMRAQGLTILNTHTQEGVRSSTVDSAFSLARHKRCLDLRSRQWTPELVSSFYMRRRNRRPEGKKKSYRAFPYSRCGALRTERAAKWATEMHQYDVRLKEQTERRRSRARSSSFGSGTGAAGAQNLNERLESEPEFQLQIEVPSPKGAEQSAQWDLIDQTRKTSSNWNDHGNWEEGTYRRMMSASESDHTQTGTLGRKCGNLESKGRGGGQQLKR